MNLKKILILPIGFILIHAFYIGCCKCIQGPFHKEITSLRVSEYGDKNFYSKDSVKVIDTLFSIIDIRYNLVAQNNANPFTGFVNAAYATSCNCGSYEDLGFKYKIDSLVITSNNVFKGEAIGKNIAKYFTCVYADYVNNTTTNITIPQLIDSININKKNYGISIFTTVAGTTNKIQRFTYKLFTSGTSFEASDTKIIIFQ
jgi:hypothetical protein